MYYKVVYSKNNKLYSIVHPEIGPEYIPGEWTIPKIEGTQLMCFSNFYFAEQFFNNWRGEIWSCEIKEYKGTPVFCRQSLFTCVVKEFITEIIDLKKRKKKFSHLTFKSNAPSGTVFCSKIKLLEKVC